MSKLKLDDTVTITRATALKYGLLICKCGHMINNHFDWNEKLRPCAHCDCKNYDEVVKES